MNMSDYTIRAIYTDAQRAAKLGLAIEDACTWAYHTEEGKWWRKVYQLAMEAKK